MKLSLESGTQKMAEKAFLSSLPWSRVMQVMISMMAMRKKGLLKVMNIVLWKLDHATGFLLAGSGESVV